MNRPVKKGSANPAPLALQDAKARFSEVVEAAMRGQAQHVTRRGKPAVVIVGAADFERMARADRAGSTGFIDHLLSIPKDARGRSLVVKPITTLRLRDLDFSS